MTTDSSIPYPDEYLRYFVLYAEGNYFEAHEVLEDLWVVEVEPLKTYYKGLIQAAVAVCHWERRNPSGALSLYRSAQEYLSRYPDQFEGIDLGAFRRTLEGFFQPLRDGDREAAFPSETIPSFSMEPTLRSAVEVTTVSH